jgi:hypothetical protein
MTTRARADACGAVVENAFVAAAETVADGRTIALNIPANSPAKATLNRAFLDTSERGCYHQREW